MAWGAKGAFLSLNSEEVDQFPVTQRAIRRSVGHECLPRVRSRHSGGDWLSPLCAPLADQGSVRWRSLLDSECQVILRSDLNAVRISSTNCFGCSQAAKCVPLWNLL